MSMLEKYLKLQEAQEYQGYSLFMSTSIPDEYPDLTEEERVQKEIQDEIAFTADHFKSVLRCQSELASIGGKRRKDAQKKIDGEIAHNDFKKDSAQSDQYYHITLISAGAAMSTLNRMCEHYGVEKIFSDVNIKDIRDVRQAAEDIFKEASERGIVLEQENLKTWQMTFSKDVAEKIASAKYPGENIHEAQGQESKTAPPMRREHDDAVLDFDEAVEALSNYRGTIRNVMSVDPEYAPQQNGVDTQEEDFSGR